MAQKTPSNLHIFGIRHHGPGSARSLKQALEALQPDVILVEGPPDAAPVLSLLAHAEMTPPVALLLYVPDQPNKSAIYPFAVFSPEWQAIQYGLSRDIPLRFMDLPQSHILARVDAEEPVPVETETTPISELQAEPETEREPESVTEATEDVMTPLDLEALRYRLDPLHALAEAAGYSDSERWWEHMVEHRQDSAGVFEAILEAMTELRQNAPPLTDPFEMQREAYMRQTIRAAQKEGFEKIAIVCGAWHSPVLTDGATPKEDAATLAGLPKVKVAATWVPWTYGRLSMASGYGAGIESPGWYDHIWTHPEKLTIRWMARVAHLLREQDLDASPAHIIEAVRLADTLASLRGRPVPGLPELNEATQSVLCFGSDLPMRLIQQKLIVSERLGAVPDETPMVPLQQDLQREQKRLRLAPELAQRVLDLDLRKPNELDRSRLLHRLRLMGIPWGTPERAHGSQGTFHELWRLQWEPEYGIKIIEVAIWGNTVFDAATAFARDKADHGADLPALTTLLDQVLLADLPDAVRHLMSRLENEAAVASDVAHLMGALPPLANVLRYGNVRQTDTTMIGHVVSSLVSRICIGLPGACGSLNDEAAGTMYGHIVAVQAAVTLLQNDDYLAQWQATLGQMANSPNLHGLIAGRCCRLLLDAGKLTIDEAAQRMGLALSIATDPPQAASWVDGFLRGSGLLLLHDATLWDVIDGWISTLNPDSFIALLPLLRRTFATFTAPERRQMGERVKTGTGHRALAVTSDTDLDQERADAMLPIIAQLLGLKIEAPV